MRDRLRGPAGCTFGARTLRACDQPQQGQLPPAAGRPDSPPAPTPARDSASPRQEQHQAAPQGRTAGVAGSRGRAGSCGRRRRRPTGTSQPSRASPDGRRRPSSGGTTQARALPRGQGADGVEDRGRGGRPCPPAARSRGHLAEARPRPRSGGPARRGADEDGQSGQGPRRGSAARRGREEQAQQPGPPPGAAGGSEGTEPSGPGRAAGGPRRRGPAPRAPAPGAARGRRGGGAGSGRPPRSTIKPGEAGQLGVAVHLGHRRPPGAEGDAQRPRGGGQQRPRRGNPGPGAARKAPHTKARRESGGRHRRPHLQRGGALSRRATAAQSISSPARPRRSG